MNKNNLGLHNFLETERGFTLIELIIAIALLGIIVISLFPVFSQGFSVISTAGNRTQQLYNDVQQELVNKIANPDPVNKETISITFQDSEGKIIPTNNTDNSLPVYKVSANSQNSLSLSYYLLEN